MRILAVDTTTRSGSLAVLQAGREALHCAVLGVVAMQGDEGYSTRLFRHLEFLLGELKLSTADMDLFAVAAGPGSFTGLRVGLTAVKGWSEIHGKPIASVGALEAIAAQVQSPNSTIVAVEDARRGHLYGGIYVREDGALRRLADDVVLAPKEFWSYLTGVLGDETFVFATPDPCFVETIAAPSPFSRTPIVSVSNMLAPAVGEVGIRKAQRGQVCDALTLDAHYVRRSDAEMLFKDK